MILLKLAASVWVVVLLTCLFGIMFAGDPQAQAILKPIALFGASLLGLLGVVAIWRYIK